MSAKEIQSPTGLDLQPRHPATVRLSKRAGVLSVLLVGGVLALVVFGVYSRRQSHARPEAGPADDRSIVAATEAGRQIIQEVPAKSLKGNLDLVAEEDNKTPQAPAAAKGNQTPSTIRAARPAARHSMSQEGNHEITAEEKRLQLEYQREQEAIDASTKVSLSGNLQTTPATPASGYLSQIQSLLQGALHSANLVEQPASTLPADSRKQSQTSPAELQQKQISIRTQPVGSFEIKSGWNIPAILEQDIRSDLPGEVRALVRENVYDTATGRWLLIPQGSRLIGAYDSRVAYGQEAVQVAWTRIIYPDASSIDLDGMVGQDASGATGFRDDVDHHYKRLVGMGLLTSIFSAGFQLSQSHRGGTLAYPSAAETVGTAVGQQMSQLGIEVTRRNLDVPPTIKVRAGYRFNVRVNRDLLFDQPYQ